MRINIIEILQKNKKDVTKETGDTSNDSQSAIKLSDSFTHEDPIAVEIRSSQTQYDLITTNRADLEKREKAANI